MGLPIKVGARGIYIEREGKILGLIGWRRKSLCWGPPRSTPVALSNVEEAPNVTGVYFSRGNINESVFRPDYGTRFALVVHIQDSRTKLKATTLRSDGKRLENLDRAIAIYQAGWVQPGHAWDLN